jgi:hypothetical protein
MAKRLLDRQVRLLEYLTSGDAIFCDRRDAPLDQALERFDRSLLRLEARFSHEKRMEKITTVFPKSFELLGNDLDGIVREFADACPPLDISRIENARQFHEFLAAHWKRKTPTPPYLPDVAAFELACARARIEADDRSATEAPPANAARPGIRRRRGVVLLRTRYDIRTIFEDGNPELVERETPIAIIVQSGEPGIFDLTSEVFDLLAALDEWTAVDEPGDAGGLIADLVEAGMLELRR